MRFVFKFGGTSLATAGRIKKVAEFIKEFRKNNEDCSLAVVVSAPGKTTNSLDALGKAFPLNDEHHARLLTLGEEISAVLLAGQLENIGVKACYLCSKDIQINAKGSPLNAVITSIDTAKLLQILKTQVAVITGFQGVDSSGKILSLGRGGSDTTAVALGVTLDAKVQIFTDVDGFYSFDPSKFEGAHLLKSINIYSAIECAYAGGKVLDKRCLEIANKHRTSLAVSKSTFLNSTSLSFDALEDCQIDTISHKIDLTFVKIPMKKINFLQSNFQFENNMIFSSIDFGREKTAKILFCSSQKLEDVLASSGIKHRTAELVSITGSGLNKEVFQKILSLIGGRKIIFADFHPTVIKIVTRQRCAEGLVKFLINELKL